MELIDALIRAINEPSHIVAGPTFPPPPTPPPSPSQKKKKKICGSMVIFLKMFFNYLYKFGTR